MLKNSEVFVLYKQALALVSSVRTLLKVKKFEIFYNPIKQPFYTDSYFVHLRIESFLQWIKITPKRSL